LPEGITNSAHNTLQNLLVVCRGHFAKVVGATSIEGAFYCSDKLLKQFPRLSVPARLRRTILNVRTAPRYLRGDNIVQVSRLDGAVFFACGDTGTSMSYYGRPIGRAILFWSCGFFFFRLSSFFPCLFSAVGDWMSTILPHTMWS